MTWPAVLAWLDQWAAHVRAADYDAGRAMFAPEVVGFGTKVRRLDGIDELEHRQWRGIWDRTSAFAIDAGTVRGEVSGDLAVAFGQWSGRAGRAPESQGPERSGRLTVVLRAMPDGRLLAHHTHLSMDPQPAPSPANGF